MNRLMLKNSCSWNLRRLQLNSKGSFSTKAHLFQPENSSISNHSKTTISTTEKFRAILPDVCQEVGEQLSQRGLMPQAVERVKQSMVANTSAGSILRGRIVLDTAWILNGRTLTEKQTNDLMALGCLTEFFNAAYCIWDDIMDGSPTRRGKPCWYRQQGVGLTAINDGLLLRSAIYVILKQRFCGHPAYHEFLELFTETSLRTEIGQYLDTMASTQALKISQFTWEQYEYIVENKTSNYTYYVPMALPMLYLGLASPERLNEVYQAAKILGLIFQARDDLLDVYGDPLITGKIGTDIQENKCSWLSVHALKNASDEQKKILETCYGSENADDVMRVKNLFDELDLAGKFRDWDQGMRDKAQAMFDGASHVGLTEAFSLFLSKYIQDPRRGLPRSTG